jgi:hypothetical protein
MLDTVKQSGHLPPLLFLKGVEKDKEVTAALFAGSFGEVYTGIYLGKKVALKKPLPFQSEFQRQRWFRAGLIYSSFTSTSS